MELINISIFHHMYSLPFTSTPTYDKQDGGAGSREAGGHGANEGLHVPNRAAADKEVREGRPAAGRLCEGRA